MFSGSPSPRADPHLSDDAVRRSPISAGRRQVRRTFDTVSVRMLAIILLASVPLALLSAAMSWHSYKSASSFSAVRAASLVTVFRSRAQQDLGRSNAFLQDMAGLDELSSPNGCATALHLALVAEAPRYLSLGVTDPAFHLLCAAGERFSDLSGLAGPPVGDGIRRVTMLRNASGLRNAAERPAMMATLVSSAGAGSHRLLVADLTLGWRHEDIFGHAGEGGILDQATPMQAWLIGPGREIAPLCVDCGWRQPDNFAAIRTMAAAGDGAAIAYDDGSAALGALVGPVQVLILTSPSPQEERALSVFIIRVIGIVLLLGLGLVAVSVGANLLVVAPLQGLTGAVKQWRRAGEYEPGQTRLMPVELRELSRAFTQATRSLASHEHTLRQAEAKQELLIKEIHHRVKNNLQIIASLLNLQANRIRAPEARAEFASARDRVRALATLHRYLYSEGDLQTLNMRSFLQELCSQLFQAIGEKEGRRIQLHIEAPEIAMATDQAVPLSLIVTEAVSNALKYAFPAGRVGHVHVTLSELDAGMGRLVIQDDGIGIPAGRAETESGVRDGLGIQLIRGFARQLGAGLEVHEGEGTCYTLTFPLHPEESDGSQGADADDTADGPDDEAA